MNRFLLIPLIVAGLFFMAACSKDDETSDRFNLLTGSAWLSDSLLINGEDASGPGQLLENFRGTAHFREDYTGTFGNYEGTWSFAQNETELVIRSDSLPIPMLSTKIQELTQQSLKVTTSFPDLQNPTGPALQIRLTFKAE
ncbi:MAG: hypothetical protein EA361_05550 [Bacteroidetes bacterium]|nr:MAG: hypothetical protein EA361_05550 [Bacteroidota bacterium]